MLLWMRPADAVEFGERLHAELGSGARWQKIMPGLQRGPTSELLGELIAGEGEGADLQLKDGGPIIQYLGGRLVAADSPIALPGDGPVLKSGQLAFRWSPNEEPPKVRGEFEKLAKLVFRVMRECTLPGLVQLNGKPYRSGRIGKAALELVRSQGVELRDTSAPRNRLEVKAAPGPRR
jgi:hypothetical protein